MNITLLLWICLILMSCNAVMLLSLDHTYLNPDDLKQGLLLYSNAIFM